MSALSFGGRVVSTTLGSSPVDTWTSIGVAADDSTMEYGGGGDGGGGGGGEAGGGGDGDGDGGGGAEGGGGGRCGWSSGTAGG